MLNRLSERYIAAVKSDAESKRSFPVFVENGVIYKASYLRECDWFVICANGYPLGSKSFNYMHSGFRSFDDAINVVKKYLSESCEVKTNLVSKILEGGSVRDILKYS